jgi:hypothetical protein
MHDHLSHLAISLKAERDLLWLSCLSCRYCFVFAEGSVRLTDRPTDRECKPHPAHLLLHSGLTSMKKVTFDRILFSLRCQQRRAGELGNISNSGDSVCQKSGYLVTFLHVPCIPKPFLRSDKKKPFRYAKRAWVFSFLTSCAEHHQPSSPFTCFYHLSAFLCAGNAHFSRLYEHAYCYFYSTYHVAPPVLTDFIPPRAHRQQQIRILFSAKKMNAAIFFFRVNIISLPAAQAPIQSLRLLPQS